jgi:hypothetical protein
MSPAEDYPIAHCAPCARDVLTHVHLDAGGDEHRLCLHCDAEIDPTEVRWVGDDELSTLGYGLFDGEGAGCGRPDCGRGNCGNRR